MTTDLVVSDDDYLNQLADRVRLEYRRSREAVSEAVDAYFAIGQSLLEARQVLPSDPEFGRWFIKQDFGFTQQWARVLRTAAEYETSVRALLQSQLCSNRAPNIEKAVKQATAALGGGRSARPPLALIKADNAPAVFPTVVVDPPWQYDNTATRGAAEDHYPTMTIDELEALDIPAESDAHLYLWVTNAFLHEGFHLLEAWNFTYKTCLTWCKPSIGMGNYFRNNTEHVLFAVRGSLPTRRANVGTWFEAPKTKHSTKPASFFDLVESCSPGPYYEMFARRKRLGWENWGNEA